MCALSSTAPARPALPWPTSTWRWAPQKQNILMCDSRGVIYAGREEGMNEFKVQYAAPTHARTLGRRPAGRRRIHRPVRTRLRQQGDGAQHGARPHHLRHGQSGPGDHLGSRPGRAQRRHLRHRPQRLPQPGEQRAGLPLHLPRCAGCSRPRHQHGNEDGRGTARWRPSPRRTYPTR